MDFQIGQIIRMKKPHPCGGNTWEIQTCGHMVMIPRRVVEKGFRGFVEE